MSLHLGNLSPRIRKDELERVFRRFGRCTVQLKDCYGFAVFDFRGDAENALRELKGRKICGQLIHLSWSNKQPKPLKSFARASESHDMRYGRISGRVDNHVCQKFSGSHRDYTMGNKLPDDDGGGHKAVVAHDHRGSFDHNNVEHDCHHHREGFLEDDGYVEPVHVDNGSWGDQVDIPQDVNGDDEKIGFDRYEPDCADEREECENRSLGNTEGSPSGKTLIDVSNRVHHADGVTGHYTCFKCGAAGHKMHDCPLRDALHGKSLYCSGHGHEDEGDSKSREWGKDGGPESKSRERLKPRSRNSRSARQHEANGKKSLPERDETKGRSSPDGNASNRTKMKDYNRKRQREREDQIGEMLDDKKSKSLPSSHLHAEGALPHFGTQSESQRTSPDSILRSRSGPPVKFSLSAKSRSETRSSQSRFRRVMSKSRSGLSSPSSSLSISHGRSLPSSPNKEEIDLNESALDPQFKENLTEAWQESEPGTGDEKISTDNKADAGASSYVENSSFQLGEYLIGREQLEPDLKDENETSENSTYISLNGSLVDLIPQSQERVHAERWHLEPESRNNSLKVGDVPARSEDMSSASEVRDDRKMNQSHIGSSTKSIVPLVSCEIKIPCSPTEQGDRETAAGQPSAEKLREAKELENGNCVEMVKSLEPTGESYLKAPLKAQVGSHMNISGEELCRVLKHYGLKHPEEDGQTLGAEDYFGAACLWPWALIYYRRLKKGPVPEENYAKRAAQIKHLASLHH